MKYSNPIIRGFNPDPSICFDGTFYYLVTSSFEFYPGLPIYRSKDLVNWDHIGNVLENQQSVDIHNVKNSQGLFAPTIRYYQGTFYVVCTNITQGNFITKTNDPSQKWSEPVFIDCPNGIDPSLTFYENKCYMHLTTSSKNRDYSSIILFEINPTNGKVLSSFKTISNGCGGKDVEAPHIYFAHNYFYLVLAENGTREGHMVTIQRSKNIGGPYTSCPSNPILTNRNKRGILQNVGHADFFQDVNKNWWCVALASRQIHHLTLLGRETILLPVNWNGIWPLVNNSSYATIDVETNLISSKQLLPELLLQNQFTEKNIRTLGLSTNFSIKNKSLTLQNHNVSIQTPITEPISFVSVSQAEFNVIFTTTLDLTKLSNGDFGMIIYKDDHHFLKTYISKNEKLCSANINGLSLDIEITKPSVKITKTELIEFKLCGTQDQYILSINDITSGKKNTLTKVTIATNHFTSELANYSFTGVQLGLFSKSKIGETNFDKVELIYNKF
ncbi:family 43 glycosylhydrolase [Pediococcus acidilactici]|nr:family 43 glycosylhydrolase [Pediococcus acidilactici]UWF34296.1 glycoside hydrolase family 43 protein [Pediococcus acidilactici]